MIFSLKEHLRKIVWVSFTGIKKGIISTLSLLKIPKLIQGLLETLTKEIDALRQVIFTGKSNRSPPALCNSPISKIIIGSWKLFPPGRRRKIPVIILPMVIIANRK